MKRSVFVSTLLAAIILSGIADGAVADLSKGDQIRLMRRPDINQGRIVFSYQSDLWMVPEEGGLARRLTVHEGSEDYPKFSPDGTKLAFCGDYNERVNSLFVMPSNGGVPMQLTYHSSTAEPVTWTRDGKHVIFASERESFVRFFDQFFKVPVDGGLPVDMGIGKASFGSFSPDGTKIAFNRHPGRFWWWKRYKGSQNNDVWIYDFAKDTFTRITTYEGNDSWPMWTGNSIYYVSDRADGIANLWVHDLGTGADRQVTKFEKHGVTWPSMSSDGKKIVFEREARLYVYDTASETAREVVVYAPTDDRTNMISYVDPMQYLRGFDISPNAKRIVFDARGELFTAPVKHGDVRNLTNSSGSRDTSPSWSPDGKWIAYVSDKSGDDEIYLADQMGKDPERKLTTSGHFKTGLVWAPDSKSLAFSTEANALYILDPSSGDEQLVVRNEHNDITTYGWSPDSRWLAYDFSEKNRTRDIYFYDTKEKKHHQITKNLADDTEPTFTPDGKYLLLVTDRYNGAISMCRLSLLPEKEEPFLFPDDEETGEPAADEEDSTSTENEKPGRGNKKEIKKKEPVVVKIDFNGIEDRIRKIPKTGGMHLHNIQAAENHYFYLTVSARRVMMRVTWDLYSFDVKKIKVTKIASTISAYGLAADKEHLCIYDGSKFQVMKVGSKARTNKPGDTETDDEEPGADIRRQTKLALDRRAEWEQIFNEGWRVVKYHFYDENHHGVDWDYMREYYSSLLPYVRTRYELNTLMSEMVGELNASHQGVSGGDGGSVARASMASLGAKIVLDEKTGYPRFEKIYKGDKLSLRETSPLDNEFVKVRPGDYLLAIDGHELKPGENYNKYLVSKTRNKISILTNSKPELKGAVETKFMPIYTDGSLMYKDWTDANEAKVDEASGGKIGYMHLADMSGSGWTEFREKFDQYRYKDAIIIDVRYNGGGSIDTRVIDYLERRPYQYTQARGESAIERPEDCFTGKVVVLCNEYSYSDAEVFPSAVKERGLGTVIGVPTLGFVIAVTPHELIDGGTIRKTFIGIWEQSTGKLLESRGAIPDIIVESPPEMEKAGKDVQLDKAVEFLLDAIAKDPRDLDYDTSIEKR